jgi:NADH:quinone reductase (non-electrogenic)
VLVGAGTVGVEMASTLAEMSRMALAHDFRHIDPRHALVWQDASGKTWLSYNEASWIA